MLAGVLSKIILLPLVIKPVIYHKLIMVLQLVITRLNQTNKRILLRLENIVVGVHKKVMPLL